MPRSSVLHLVVLAMLMGLAAAGCAASAPWGPALIEVPQTAVPVATPAAAGPTSLPTLPAIRLTVPTPTPMTFRMPAVQEPREIEQLLRSMVQFRVQLAGLARDEPKVDDLVRMTRRTAELMAEAHQLIDRMSATQRKQAMFEEVSLADGLQKVMTTFNSHSDAEGPTAVKGLDPGILPGKPLSLTGTARTWARNPPPSMVLANDIQQIHERVRELAGDEPSTEDIVIVISSIQSTLNTIYQLTPALFTEDLQMLTAGMALTVADMVDVMEALAREARPSPFH